MVGLEVSTLSVGNMVGLEVSTLSVGDIVGLEVSSVLVGKNSVILLLLLFSISGVGLVVGIVNFWLYEVEGSV